MDKTPEYLERLAFIEQVAGATPTHRVCATRTGDVLYTGPEAAARWVYEGFFIEFCWGVDDIGPVSLEALPSDGTHQTDGESETPGQE